VVFIHKNVIEETTVPLFFVILSWSEMTVICIWVS